MARVEILIDKDGTTEVEINGVCGPGCADFTEAIKAVLDPDDIEEETKDTFYEQEVEGEVTA